MQEYNEFNLYAYSSGEIRREKEKKGKRLNHKHIPLFHVLFAQHRTEQDRPPFPTESHHNRVPP